MSIPNYDFLRRFLSADAINRVFGSTSMTESSGASVTHCHGLRPERMTTGEVVLRPVTSPEPVVSAPWRPLVKMHCVDGQLRLIVASGNTVGEIKLNDDGVPAIPTIVNTVDTVDYEPVCAVVEGPELVVMTARGPVSWILGNDGGWLRVEPYKWPALSLMAVDGADCTAEVPSRKLQGTYSDGSRHLLQVDHCAVTRDVRRAYLSVAHQAAAAGALCAPLLVRYQFVSHSGAILYVSPPQLLSASESARLAAPISVSSSDRRRLSSYSVSARSWRLRVSSSAPVPQTMADIVSRIEILAIPQFHPFDPAGEVSVSVVSDAASDEMLRITLPGADRALAPANGAAASARLQAAVGAMERLERVVAVIQGPLDDGEVIDIYPDIPGLIRSVGDECRALDRALEEEIALDFVHSYRNRLSAPHSFSAGCAVADAGYTLWGDLEALRFDGFQLESFAAERAGQGAWHGAVAVTFATGDERVVALSSGSSGAPLRFNPLLSYPAPDAVAMTLMVSAGGVVRSATLPLVPDSSGRRAVYISPTFAPFALTNQLPAFVVPDVRRLPRPMPSFVAVTNSRAPAVVLDVSTVGEGRVSDLCVAPRSRLSWDYSRPRFTLLSDSGVYTVTLPAARAPALSLYRIDSRPVARNAVCDVGGRLWAVAGDTLVDVGASSVRDLICSVSADRMAYDAVHKELWLSSASGSITTVVSVDSLKSYTRDELLASRGVDGFAVVNGSLCRLGSESSPQSVFVRWDGEIPLSDSHVSPRLLRLDLSAARVSYGSLTVRRRLSSASAPAAELRLSLNGRIAAPLTVPLRSLPARRLAFSLQGRLSPDAVISSLTLYYSSLWKKKS